MEKFRFKYGFPEKEFEKFFRLHYKLALIISVRITNDLVSSEDIVQEIFLQLWEKPELDLSDPKLKSYLLKSTRNRSLNHIRDKKEQMEFVPGLHELFDEEYNFEREEKISKVLFEIENLPPRRKEIFKMIVFKQLKYNEVAEILNISNNTIKTQLNIAYAQLRKFCTIFF